MALSNLLYISDLTDRVNLDDLLAIQAVSIRNNARQNITGILFHINGNFVQLLEGEEADIRELFDTICEDPRHESVRLLYVRPADERVFDEWHMAMLDLELHGEEQRRDLKELVRIAESPPTQSNGHAKPPRDVEILYQVRELLLFA